MSMNKRKRWIQTSLNDLGFDEGASKLSCKRRKIDLLDGFRPEPVFSGALAGGGEFLGEMAGVRAAACSAVASLGNRVRAAVRLSSGLRPRAQRLAARVFNSSLGARPIQ
jgi:hypothetical protein